MTRACRCRAENEELRPLRRRAASVVMSGVRPTSTHLLEIPLSTLDPMVVIRGPMKPWRTLLEVPSQPTTRRLLDLLKTTLLPTLNHPHSIRTMPTHRIQTHITLQRRLLRCIRSTLRATHLRLDRLIQLTTIASATRLGGEKKKRVSAARLARLLLATHMKRDLQLVILESRQLSRAMTPAQDIPGPRQVTQAIHLATTRPIRPTLRLTNRLICGNTPTTLSGPLTGIEAGCLRDTRRETGLRTQRLPVILDA